MRTRTAIFLSLLIISCELGDKKHTTNSSSISGPKDSNLHAARHIDTISYALLCKPIDSVNKMFTAVSDSIFESEGVEWPGKVVTHSDKGQTYFESSWTDKKSIWRVTTTSRTIKFQTPYQVGDPVAKIKDGGYTFTFNEGDGGMYFYFTDERLRNVGFRVEDQFASDFYNNIYEEG